MQVNHKSKVFVANKSATPIDSKKFLKIVERSHHIISLYFSLPKTDKGKRNRNHLLLFHLHSPSILFARFFQERLRNCRSHHTIQINRQLHLRVRQRLVRIVVLM